MFDVILIYNSTNIAFIVYSVGSCKKALNMISFAYKKNFTRSVQNKLCGDVYHSILGIQFHIMKELVGYLCRIYILWKTVYKAQKRLVYVFQQLDKNVIIYINRVKEMGKEF